MSNNPTSGSAAILTTTSEPTPEGTLNLSWSQIRSILKHGAEQTQNAMNSAIASKSENTEPLITCSICLEPYHSVNVEGQIEEPALAACGHIFGHVCIERWLAHPMKHVGPTCPVCRFPLKFSSCHHAIGAVDPYDTTNRPPPTLKSDRSDLPHSCSECSLRNLPGQSRLRSLERQKTEFINLLKSLEVTLTQSKATGKNDVLERALKTKGIYTNGLQSTERELLASKDKAEEEKFTFLENLKKKPVWHLKVDSAKWGIPDGERHQDAYGFGEEDDEDEDEVDDDDSLDVDSDEDDSMTGIEDLAERISEGLSAGDDGEDIEVENLIDLD